MKTKTSYGFFMGFVTGIGILANAQSNTAVTSGNIGQCRVWGFPYTLYNTVSATKTIGNGVTVTVNENKNSGDITLNGNGALNFSGSNGITFSGTGSQLTCRWEASIQSGSHTITNNDGNAVPYSRDVGTFFTAPYSGNYGWISGPGWGAVFNNTNAYNGSVLLKKNGATVNIFFQDQNGSCSLPGSTNFPPTWWNDRSLGFANAGDTYQYALRTGFTSNPSCHISMTATIGPAQIVYDN